MSEIFRALGLVFSILSDDHSPPHVHVFGSGWMAKISLSNLPDLIFVVGRPTKQEIRKALRQVRSNLPRLMDGWEKIHGRLD